MNRAGMLIKILAAEDSELAAKSGSEILKHKDMECIEGGWGPILRYLSAATVPGKAAWAVIFNPSGLNCTKHPPLQLQSRNSVSTNTICC